MLLDFALHYHKAEAVEAGSFDYLGWRVLSETSIHTDESDPCDPILTTRAVQFSDIGWVNVLADHIANGVPEQETVEDLAARWLEASYTIPSCWCEHDCCGHRSGHANVKHVTGSVFLIQTHSSRNY